METNFKSRSFTIVFWIMLIVLVGDTLDTFNRLVIGYFTTGVVSIPGGPVVELTTISLVISIPTIVAVLYGIYLLYKRKKVGGYWVLGANLLGNIVGFTVGPLSGHLSEGLPFFVIYFVIMIIVVIGIPRFYSEKFE